MELETLGRNVKSKELYVSDATSLFFLIYLNYTGLFKAKIVALSCSTYNIWRSNTYDNYSPEEGSGG